MKCNVKPDSCSKPFPLCGHIRRPSPCLTTLQDFFKRRSKTWEDDVCLDFHNISVYIVLRCTAETLDQENTNAALHSVESWKFPPGRL